MLLIRLLRERVVIVLRTMTCRLVRSWRFAKEICERWPFLPLLCTSLGPLMLLRLLWWRWWRRW